MQRTKVPSDTRWLGSHPHCSTHGGRLPIT
jgi:hypothetical protein